MSWDLDDVGVPGSAGEPAPRGDEPEGDPTLTVPQVAARISALLASGFPAPFWMVGETSGLARTVGRPGGHWYFNLVDDEADDDRSRASLSVKMWRSTVQKLFASRGRMAGFEPTDGVVLRVLVEPDFYAPRGALSFTIKDIDPEFTLGSLDRQRKELLRRLESEGALQTNKARPLLDVPLRVGLVTSRDSAAHHDFMEGIAASPASFSVVFCDARMQGPDTGPAVTGALAALVAAEVDVIAVVRGGGSRLDLSWFDKEDVARAIAGCPLPVLTGIGHEIDTSVADAVAHASFKTPTAVAEFLAGRARDALRAVEDCFLSIRGHAEAMLGDGRRDLLEVGRAIQVAVSERLRLAAQDLAEVGPRVRAAARDRLTSCHHALLRATDRLARGAHIDELRRAGDRLVEDGRHLQWFVDNRLAGHEAALAAAAHRVRLLDPASVLSRGYAWLRRPDGRVLKEAAAAVPGERVTAVVRDGEIDLITETSRPRAEPGPGIDP